MFLSNKTCFFVVVRVAVFQEGTKFIESLPEQKLAAIALKYMRKEAEVASLVAKIKQDSGIGEDDMKYLTKILEEGGARTALKFV
jgi:hypothetical protein